MLPWLQIFIYVTMVTDIDECAEEIDNCDNVNGNCTDGDPELGEALYTCTCNAGYFLVNQYICQGEISLLVNAKQKMY